MIFARTLVGAALALTFAAPAWADFPDRPVTIVVGFEAGGGSDTAARLLAGDLEQTLGQKVIVENRGGAGGGVAASYVRQQPGDGYTIGFAVATTFAFDPLLGAFDYSVDDFDYVAAVAGYRSVFTAPADAPFQDWAGMLAAARERGWLNYASIIPLDRKIIESIGRQEGIEINIVPTRGGAGARQAVMGGHVDLGFSASNAIPMHQDGALRILAAAIPDGIDELPDVPTLRELGYDAYSRNYMVFFGPDGMDETARATLEAAIAKAAKTPAFRDFVVSKFYGRDVVLTGDEIRQELTTQSQDYRALLDSLEE